MKNSFNIDTFLFLGPKKIILSVNQMEDFKSIFREEISIENFSNELNFEILDDFLNNNIFKAEKILGDFIKSINVIIDSNEFFILKLSIKKSSHNDVIDSNILTYLLNDAKDQCDKSIENKKILHLLIDSYHLDNNSYSDLPIDLKCQNFSVDLRFICLSINIIKKIEKVCKKYQISTNKLLSAKYINEFFNDGSLDFFEMASKIIKGCNNNEVKLVNKRSKKQGFFERFFEFFS